MVQVQPLGRVVVGPFYGGDRRRRSERIALATRYGAG
jgi:hypothetical protein